MDTYNTEVNSVSDIISLAVPSKETVDYMDQHIGLNQTQRAAAEIFIGALVDPGTYESVGKFAGKMNAKPDGPSLNEIANETLLPDSEISFTDFMSAEDAARYNAWNLECANGTHNSFPGLKEIAMKEETRLRDFLEGN